MKILCPISLKYLFLGINQTKPKGNLSSKIVLIRPIASGGQSCSRSLPFNLSGKFIYKTGSSLDKRQHDLQDLLEELDGGILEI